MKKYIFLLCSFYILHAKGDFAMSEAQILLYNFKDENRLRQIRRYLNRQKISLRMVQPSEYLESLGFLFEIPGFAQNSVFNIGQNFNE